IVQGIVSHLEKQKADTQAGRDGASFGIQFNADAGTYTLYKGPGFNPSSDDNQPVQLNSKFLLSETISNPSNVIFFSRLYGEANQTATITISHKEDRISPQVISIEQSGTISVVE